MNESVFLRIYYFDRYRGFAYVCLVYFFPSNIQASTFFKGDTCFFSFSLKDDFALHINSSLFTNTLQFTNTGLFMIHSGTVLMYSRCSFWKSLAYFWDG